VVMSIIRQLATRQLDAYNASDLDAFVACFHPDVRLFVGEDEVCRGNAAFREHYRRLFEDFTFGGQVPTRIDAGDHCVDLEHWWRINDKTGDRDEGTALVHYQVQDELIGLVRLMR